MRWLFLLVFVLVTVSSALSQVSAGPDQSICLGQSTTLQGTGPSSGYDFTWTSVPNDPTISNPNILTPTVEPSSTTTYTLEGRTVSDLNLVDNGDFEQGNIGFTSSYDYCDVQYCLHSSPANGEYGINDDPNFLHEDFPSCGDHTSGSGNMMIANGAEQANTTLYEITVNNISTNTEYELSTWLTSMVYSIPMFGANLQFEINGEVLGTLNAPSTVCSWLEFSQLWNSGSATSATIRIVNLTAISSGLGNDFAIDDVALYEVIKEYDDCIVTVLDIPTSTFNLPSQICDSDTVLITYTGNAPPSPTAEYNWDFGTDALVISGTGEGPYQVIWSTAGTKTISLWVEFDCISDTTYQDILINESPIVDITADAISIPYGTSTILHGLMNGTPGPLQFYWEPASMLVNPLNQDPQTIPLEQTTVYYFYVEDQSSGCASNDSIIIEVTGGALAIVSITGTPDTVCPGVSTTLNANVLGGNLGSYTAIWTSNPSGYSNTGMTVIASPTITTTYIINVDDGYNSVTDSVTIIVLPSTSIISQPQDVQLIEGALANFSVTADFSTGYQWQESTDNGVMWNNLFNGNEYSGVNSPTLQINPVTIVMDGNIYRCSISGECNDISTDEALLNVLELPDFIGSLDQANICVNDTFSIACNVSNFLQIIDFNLSVEYNSSILSYQGLSNIAPEIAANLGEISSGNNITLSWSSLQELTLPNGILFDFTFIALSEDTTAITWNHQMSNVTNQPGLQPTLDLTDSEIIIKPLPTPPDYSLVDNDTINIANVVNITLATEGGSGDELIWSSSSCYGDTVGSGTLLEIMRPEQTTTYYAYWINQCGSSLCSDVQVVIIYDFNIGVPNAFTPNGDGLNDEFKIVSNVILDEFQLQIYNRWGQLVFETSDQHIGWDGTYNGNSLKSGSYVWKINYKFEPGGLYSNATETGTVTIIN